MRKVFRKRTVDRGAHPLISVNIHGIDGLIQRGLLKIAQHGIAPIKFIADHAIPLDVDITVPELNVISVRTRRKIRPLQIGRRKRLDVALGIGLLGRLCKVQFDIPLAPLDHGIPHSATARCRNGNAHNGRQQHGDRHVQQRAAQRRCGCRLRDARPAPPTNGTIHQRIQARAQSDACRVDGVVLRGKSCAITLIFCLICSIFIMSLLSITLFYSS